MDPLTQEWDQQRAEQHSLDTMRRIALDAMEFKDDEGPAFYSYAVKHDLTVNEIVYYLNAYEAGGDASLEAIRNPDIISPDIAQSAIHDIAVALNDHFEGRLPYRLTDEGTAIGVYEIQQRINGDKYLFAICQFRLTLKDRKWHLYWMRKFGAWWPYPPPEGIRKYALKTRIQQLLHDEYGCFWG